MFRLGRFLVVGCAALVSACAANPDLSNGLAALKGQNRDAAIAVLGFPSDQKEIAGKDVYVWSSGASYVSPGGYYGCHDIYGGGLARSMTCMNYPPTVYSSYCTIRVIAEKDGTIVRTDFEGAGGGCSRYEAKFPHAKSGE